MLTMTLNREKARIVKLEHEVNSLTKKLEEKQQNSTPTSSDRRSPFSTTAANRAPKSDKLMQKNTDLQQQINSLKNDNQKLKSIIQREVMGVDAISNTKQAEEFESTLEKMMNMASGDSSPTTESEKFSWRGRAQQIILLKAKIKELKRKYDGMNVPSETASVISIGSSNSAASSADVDDKSRRQLEKLEQKARVELSEMKREVMEKNEAIAELKMKIDALNARTRTLEKANQDYKTKLARLLEKTNTDNKLIEALKAELEKKVSSQCVLVMFY